MKMSVKIIIISAVALGLVGVMLARRAGSSTDEQTSRSEATATRASAPTAPAESTTAPVAPASTPVAAALPRLLDLGADKCVPCKMMVPVLERLETAFEGQLEVDFIDVWKNPDAGRQYGIQSIPTQIFYDATGEERFRHVGFVSYEDILAKFAELGIELDKSQE